MVCNSILILEMEWITTALTLRWPAHISDLCVVLYIEVQPLSVVLQIAYLVVEISEETK